MRFRRILPKLSLIIGFFCIYLIIRYQNPIKDFLSFNLEKIKIHFYNFFYESGSGLTRRRPIIFIEREIELKLYIGEPFRDFTKKDWDEFWNIIYGVFPKDAPEKEGLPRKVRQLTEDEIASELMSRYPQPFAYFNESNWKIFFGIVLKK